VAEPGVHTHSARICTRRCSGIRSYDAGWRAEKAGAAGPRLPSRNARCFAALITAGTGAAFQEQWRRFLEDILGESIGNRRARPLDQPRLKKRRGVEQREVEAGLSPNNEDFAVSDRTEGGVTEAALNTNTPEGGHGTRTPRGTKEGTSTSSGARSERQRQAT